MCNENSTKKEWLLTVEKPTEMVESLDIFWGGPFEIEQFQPCDIAVIKTIAWAYFAVEAILIRYPHDSGNVVLYEPDGNADPEFVRFLTTLSFKLGLRDDQDPLVRAWRKPSLHVEV